MPAFLVLILLGIDLPNHHDPHATTFWKFELAPHGLIDTSMQLKCDGGQNAPAATGMRILHFITKHKHPNTSSASIVSHYPSIHNVYIMPGPLQSKKICSLPLRWPA